MYRNTREKRFRRTRHLQVAGATKLRFSQLISLLFFFRVVGVTSKVNKLLVMGLDRRKTDKVNLDDPQEWETKTITSAMKTYLRNLPEPLMSFRYHNDFINAVSKWTVQFAKEPCLSWFFQNENWGRTVSRKCTSCCTKYPRKILKCWRF